MAQHDIGEPILTDIPQFTWTPITQHDSMHNAKLVHIGGKTEDSPCMVLVGCAVPVLHVTDHKCIMEVPNVQVREIDEIAPWRKHNRATLAQ